MEIRKYFHARKFLELFPVPRNWVCYFAAYRELPAVEGDVGWAACVEHRPFQRAGLSGWHPVAAASVGTHDYAGRQGFRRTNLFLLRFRLVHSEYFEILNNG